MVWGNKVKKDNQEWDFCDRFSLIEQGLLVIACVVMFSVLYAIIQLIKWHGMAKELNKRIKKDSDKWEGFI